MTIKKVSKWIVLAALFGAMLYVTVYFMASHGDAFIFAEQAIKNSQILQSQIGRIERVRLSPFGSYKEKYVDADKWVTMTVEVTGTVKTIILNMKMKKTSSGWMIEQALIDGNPLVLN